MTRSDPYQGFRFVVQVDQVIKAPIRRHRSRLRLRTILLLAFVAVAALPGFDALFLRVYENTLMRQTEAELVAQAVALSTVATADWPGAKKISEPAPSQLVDPDGVAGGTLSTIDLRMASVLPEHPNPWPSTSVLAPEAVIAAGRLAPILFATSRICSHPLVAQSNCDKARPVPASCSAYRSAVSLETDGTRAFRGAEVLLRAKSNGIAQGSKSHAAQTYPARGR